MSQMPGAGELQQTALAFIQLLSCKKETQRCVIQKSEHAPSLGPEVQTELPIQGPWFRSIVGKVPQATQSHQNKTKPEWICQVL